MFSEEGQTVGLEELALCSIGSGEEASKDVIPAMRPNRLLGPGSTVDSLMRKGLK